MKNEGRTDKEQITDRVLKRAREITKEHGVPAGLWEIFLVDAYMDVFRPAKGAGIYNIHN